MILLLSDQRKYRELRNLSNNSGKPITRDIDRHMSAVSLRKVVALP